MISAGKGPATRAIHSGPRDGRTVAPIIEKGSTVILPDAASLYDERRVTYGRAGLSTQAALAGALAELEEARQVHLFPSGLSAMTGAMLAVLKTGDEVLISDAVYKPTRRFCDHVLGQFGVTARYYNPSTSPVDLLAMAAANTRMIVLESPGSLTFEVQDAPGIARQARAHGVLTLMDNTWAAGFWFKPLVHKIDLSVQALTKYVGGHSDVFMGSVATADVALAETLDHSVWDVGWSVSPEDAYQMLRGLRTMPTRLARHQESGLEVATWLRHQPEVAQVLHPALPGAAGHDHWARDFTGAAGVFSIVLRPAPVSAVHAFLDRLSLFRLGFSWGGFESLALYGDPQFAVRRHQPAFAGPVVRLSIGLEDTTDLIEDLKRGLAALG